jgi:hypothetical protein
MNGKDGLTMCRHIQSIFSLLVLLSALLYFISPARADGGLLRLRQKVGGYQIAVFTSPTPIRVGAVDISVFVQNAETGEFVPDADVTVCLKIPGTEHVLRYPATSDAATNRLFKAAVFNVPEAGSWDAEVLVGGPRGPAQVAFAVTADGRLPRWRELWPWFGWPGVAVVLFGAHKLLARRGSSHNAIQVAAPNSARPLAEN